MSEPSSTDMLSEVAAYYTEKLALHGQSPRGVDWNGEAGQLLRFEQLHRVIDSNAASFSITDLGCGYGALYDFLSARHRSMDYLGVDVSEQMVAASRKRLGAQPGARFLHGSEADCINDYVVASGIFNVRFGRGEGEWNAYLEQTLDQMHRHSRRGFAFNCLTSYSDPDRMRADLFYADPCRLFDLCKRRFAPDVALLHDYGLYEFTILVRKPA